jgi:FkbM family methyltransferase
LAGIGCARSGQHVHPAYGGLRHSVSLRLGTSDVSIYDEVVVRGEYDFPTERPTKTIVDAGANIGITALWYADRYPGAAIIAVEPHADNFGLLVENVRRHPEITPVRAALGPVSGHATLDNPSAQTCSYRYHMVDLAGATAQATVPVLTVADILDRFGMERVDLLKLDIEGAERELFQGDLDFLDRVDAIAIELHDRLVPGCSRAFFRAVADFRDEVWRGQTVLVSRPAARANPSDR